MIKADFFIIVAIILFFSCHVMTNYLIWHISGVAGQLDMAKDVVLQFEANPFARKMLDLSNFTLIYSMVVMPGIIGGLYYGLRRYLLKRGDEPKLATIAMMVLLVSAANFLNDFSILMGVLF